MKIKSIAAICKKNKQVVLFNRYSDSGTISQYIGDGNAVYPISGLPELDEESILTIFDVPEKQREDWLVQYRDIPEGISFEDTDATEKIIEQGNLSIVYSGKTLKPLQTRHAGHCIADGGNEKQFFRIGQNGLYLRSCAPLRLSKGNGHRRGQAGRRDRAGKR